MYQLNWHQTKSLSSISCNLISLFVNLIISYKGGLRKSQRKLSGMQTLYSATDISASLDKFPAQYDRNPHEVRLRRYYNGCNF